MNRKIAKTIILFILLTINAKVHAQNLVFSTFDDYKIITDTIFQVMTEAYNRLGITIEIMQYPGERAIRTANKGNVDGELFRKKEGIEQAYPNLIKVPVCIHTVDFVVFTKDKTFSVNGWDSLIPYRVDYKRGVKAVEMNIVKGTHYKCGDLNVSSF